MRELNECQAEVFRRSEKRIRQRKQRRKHILMACLPLVLGVVLFSALVLPAMMSEDSKVFGAAGSTMDGLTEDREENRTGPVAKIEVSGLGVSLSYTDASDILRISDRLYAFGVRGMENKGSAGDKTMGEVNQENAEGLDDLDSVLSDSSNTGITITLVMREGGKTEYYLVGNTLENRTTHQRYILSQNQMEELKNLLGITFP